VVMEMPLNEMNKLLSRKTSHGFKNMDLHCEKQMIENNNWNYESDVVSGFYIAHDDNNIYLKFIVNESNTKAVYTKFNQPVWEDSCVEFFISFDNENYYNLEFNCIGNYLCEYGSGRHNRESLDEKLLNQIELSPSLGYNKIEIINSPTEWTLEIIIPKTIFCYDHIESFNGLKATGNFYKCGDKQVFPHFLSWNAIQADSPDFHLPEFFGKIQFE
jgi:Carbohydrate-binding family 9